MIKNLISFFKKQGPIDSSVITDLVRILIKNDVGPKTSRLIVENLSNCKDNPLECLKENIINILQPMEKKLTLSKEGIQTIMLVGANGVGKTSTTAKLAALLKKDNRITIVGADSFRAAAREQLILLLKPLGIKVSTSFKHNDPSAIVYDALQEAKDELTDLIIVDTAGRLHTQKDLMAELVKIKNTIQKLSDNRPPVILLVLDGTSGRNGIKQVIKFNEALNIDGLIITKLDGSTKAGFILETVCSTKKTINFICNGENISDIKNFDSKAFAEQFIRSEII